MNLEIIRSDYFTKEFKRLAKRYRSLIDDYEAFLDNLRDGKIYLLLIYDKADTPNVKMNVIKEIIEELGL